MASIKRSKRNPILLPDPSHRWEAVAAHNPSVVKAKGAVHMLYRAVAAREKFGNMEIEVSSIGHAVSRDGVDFKRRSQLIAPKEEWERYGCEDPRVTFFEGKFYIFYTAVKDFNAEGIKVAVAVTRDLKKIEERHIVTPFNAKAMALFPERVGSTGGKGAKDGKIAVLLTVNTDRPPAKICLALLDRIEDLWSEEYWRTWYADWQSHVIPIEVNSERDQIEVGSAPVKTKDGWLVFYSYIYNYFSPPAVFGIQAVLLDLNDPSKIVGEVKRPFLVPEAEYELYGRVPNIVFPSGALVKAKKGLVRRSREEVLIYYGATDTVSAVASMDLCELLDQLTFTARRDLVRFEGNPIIAPIMEHAWESQATFNPAAFVDGGKIHILYRAMSGDNTSTVGCASTSDGVHIESRLPEPIYVPRESFEMKGVPGGNSGCEDPRVTVIGDRMYMCYTAYDGIDPPRVAMTSIGLRDFRDRKWDWAKPVLISQPGVDDKDAAIFPKKIGGKYWLLHRPRGTDIWIDSVDDLGAFDGKTKFLGGEVLMQPRDTMWDSRRIGGTAPPVETKYGWLLFYHGISRRTGHYNIRAALLDLKDPRLVLYRTHDPLLEPEMPYEKEGVVNNVVFPCGAVMVGDMLYVYYGGADKYVGVAKIGIKVIAEGLAREAKLNPAPRKR